MQEKGTLYSTRVHYSLKYQKVHYVYMYIYREKKKEINRI